MKPKLGICMDGGEVEFIDTVLRTIIGSKSRRYVEVGVAYGETFHSVWTAIRGIPKACSIGIELREWSAAHCIWERFDEGEIQVMEVNSPALPVCLIRGRSTEVLADLQLVPVAFMFIDACHGKPCVMADFLAAEHMIEQGGLVAFHDAGDIEQGGDFQPHCKQPIGVQDALKELGLWTNERSGWVRLKDIPTQNRCAVFQKL